MEPFNVVMQHPTGMFSWESFHTYVATVDAPKLKFLPLWKDGVLQHQLASVEIDSSAQEIIKRTSSCKESTPFIEWHLPNKQGIDLETFDYEASLPLIEYIHKTWPTSKPGYTVKEATKDAFANPGTRVYYDGGNGYWRSCIGKLVEEYREFTLTGVYPLKRNTTKPTEFCISKFFLGMDPTKKTEKRKLIEVTQNQLNEPLSEVDPTKKTKKRKLIEVTQNQPNEPPSEDEVICEEVQQYRILSENPALMKYLANHPDGNYITNPHQKQAGRETMEKTREKMNGHIKCVIRDWMLSSGADRYLAAADLKRDEVTIDRIIPRNGPGGGGLNCIWNLCAMPFRKNSQFGNELSPAKRAYIGKKACDRAEEAHKRFNRDQEAEYDWSPFANMIKTRIC